MLCILPELASKFKQAIKKKKFNLKDFIQTDSEGRKRTLEEYMDKETSAFLNKEFEKKLILKNKLQGIENWISKATASGRYSAETIKKMKQARDEYKQAQSERIFDPKEDQSFLGDLAEQKLGFGISREQSKQLFEFSQKSSESLKDFDYDKLKWNNERSAEEHAAAEVSYLRLKDQILNKDKPIKDMLSDRYQQFQTEYKKNPASAISEFVKDSLIVFKDNLTSIVGSVDDSFVGRQGIKRLQTWDVKGWTKNFVDSINTIYQESKGIDTTEALMYRLFKDPLYINGEYKKAGLLDNFEDQFPTSLPSRIPGIGKLFSISESAFKNTATAMRTEMYKIYRDAKVAGGIKMTDEEIKSTGKIIATLTSKSTSKKGGGIESFVLWSPSMLKSNINFLTANMLNKEVTWRDKGVAVGNLAKAVATTVILLGVAKAINPDSVETDPTSADFGKIKIGDTRIDVTGGVSSIITLAARLIIGSSKSTTTGISKPYGTGYGQKNKFDAFVDFIVNKMPPLTGTIARYYRGQNFGQKQTLGTIAFGFLPISIQGLYKDIKNPSYAATIGTVLDLFGFNSNTYEPYETDWSISTSKEMTQFKQTVGDNKFKEANDKFNQQLDEKTAKLLNAEEYKNMSDEDKQSTLSSLKDSVKKDIFNEYNFKYKQSSTDKNNSKELTKTKKELINNIK